MNRSDVIGVESTRRNLSDTVVFMKSAKAHVLAVLEDAGKKCERWAHLQSTNAAIAGTDKWNPKDGMEMHTLHDEVTALLYRCVMFLYELAQMTTDEGRPLLDAALFESTQDIILKMMLSVGDPHSGLCSWDLPPRVVFPLHIMLWMGFTPKYPKTREPYHHEKYPDYWQDIDGQYYLGDTLYCAKIDYDHMDHMMRSAPIEYCFGIAGYNATLSRNDRKKFVHFTLPWETSPLRWNRRCRKRKTGVIV